MLRRRNDNTPGHAHELTFSCYRQIPLLEAERTCLWLAEAINKARVALDFDLWAFVFMPEHVHLLLCPRRLEYDIAEIRKAIKAPVARQALVWLDQEESEWAGRLTRERGGRTERLFWQSGGGYDRNITEPTTLAKMIDYIHLNPVRRGLVEQSWEWRWSSAASFYNQGSSPLSIDPISPEWTVDEGVSG